MRNLSVIKAVEESDGQDSSVVRRPIEIVSIIQVVVMLSSLPLLRGSDSSGKGAKHTGWAIIKDADNKNVVHGWQ